MLELTASACIDAPVERVWSVLSDLAAIRHWVGAIQHAYCPGQQCGVGAVRICELSRARVEETIVEWNEGRSFEYRGVGAPMLASASNRWSVEPHGEQTLVTTVAQATLKGGALGRMLELLAKPMFKRLGAQSLASLKYYVEHGEPFPGRARDLAPASSAC
ncbi:MAG TPA: SRPBCC family protein [Polyangiaceae bacterium]|nr:SRPBCC family protein [Polyangiaceae bacterium]